jgi:DNA replication protein DnaC
VANQYRILARDAVERNCTYEEYLCTLLEQEVLARDESGRRLRIKQAGFPVLKTLEGFDFSAFPSLNKQKVVALSQCNYIKDKENIIAIGSAGTGKTHICSALARVYAIISDSLVR